MTKKPKLKPCPFCGSKPVIKTEEDNFTRIYCSNEDCILDNLAIFGTNYRAHIIKEWNTRYDDPS